MHHIIIKKDVSDVRILNINKDEFKEDYNHLVNSLRVKKGECIKVDILPCDINGIHYSYIGRFGDIGDNIEILYKNDASFNELSININLYQGLPKQDKLEFIVEKATELGVNSIIPVSMKNCIKKMDDKDAKKIDRLNKIAYQASLQSMRHKIPKVENPITYENMINKIIVKNDEKIVYNILCFEDKEKSNSIIDVINDINYKKDNENCKIEVNIIVGPEGGFDAQEIEKAKTNNIGVYSLGDRILRTETASIVALSQFINM